MCQCSLCKSVLLPSSIPPRKRKPGQLRKNPVTNVQLDTDGCDPVSSRTYSHDRCGTDISSAATPKQNCVLQLSKTDSAVTRHLEGSLSCLKAVAEDVLRCFTILARGRHATHLEAIFIDQNQPELCSQQEHVRHLSLF